MSETLRIILSIGVMVYFVIVIQLLKSKKLTLKYTLLWLLTGVVMAIFVLWPRLLNKMVNLLGIELPVNGLFALSIGFLIILAMALTSIVSKQSQKIKDLVQQTALLEERIRRMESRYKAEEM